MTTPTGELRLLRVSRIVSRHGPVMRGYLIPVLISVSMLGCRFLPNRDIKDKLSEDTIVGTWVLTEATLQLLREEGFNVSEHPLPYFITIEPRGKCQYSSAAPFKPTFIYLEEKRRYLNATCTWRLEYDTRNTLTITIKDVGTTTFGFAEENNELALWQYYGDPDSWEFFEFVKKSNT